MTFKMAARPYANNTILSCNSRNRPIPGGDLAVARSTKDLPTISLTSIVSDLQDSPINVRERKRERERERDRDRERQTDRQGQRQRDTEKKTETETEIETDGQSRYEIAHIQH